MIAAVPAYIGNNFADSPPGHRFGLYFPIWNDQTWALEKTQKSAALKQTLAIPAESRKQIDALRTRQQALVALAAADAKLSLEAEATSSLATGMGMEHPLENGFAFLNPYGLPYLPGSSIKGVLRRAAEELAQESKDVWNPTVIDVFFGHEDSNNASRGALTFWDAIPEVAGNMMGMDVMTPHYGDYYQGNGTPHDAGSPNPIVFMVIPAKSKFTFHVTADTQRLKDVQNWQALMQTAFNHAFKWLGFGAKTAVGYGAMQIVGAKQTSATTTSTPSFQTNEERWEKSTFQYQKGSGEITATGNKKRATVRGDDAKALFVKLPDDKRKLLEKQRLVATAVVKSQGNMNVLFDIV